MKIRAILLGSLLINSFAGATVTLDFSFGSAKSSSGEAVPDGTLWALVVDGGDLSFPGGFGLNQGIGQNGSRGVFSPGQELTLNTGIGEDTIIAMGGINGAAGSGVPGYSNHVLEFTLGGAIGQGKNTAVYFFPGVTFVAGTNTYKVGSQVGGENGPIDAAGNLGSGMVIPENSANVKFGALTVGNGGQVPNERFTAVNLVPEPSSILISFLATFGLLRRKRN